MPAGGNPFFRLALSSLLLLLTAGMLCARQMPEKGEDLFSISPIPQEVIQRMAGVSYPDDALVPLDDLRYLTIPYIDFSGEERLGEMVCNKLIAKDLVNIFRELYRARYRIASIRLVDDFQADDDRSMAANNTSCFNYRAALHSKKLSAHARGLAVDVNPLQNPYVKGGEVRPAGGRRYADRKRNFAHKITRDDLCCKLFISKGFTWGGSWRSLKDYQHFEKK